MSHSIKVTIIGAGSIIFSRQMMESLLLFDDILIDELALVDLDIRKLAVMERVAKKMVQQVGKSTKVTACVDRRAVLPGSSYVINSIGVGSPALYEQELLTADRYGVVQSVGDIIGPTGIFRMLRAYPSMLGICRDMEELCPDAFFFNYTNPMAPLTLALCRETSIKVFGFCHSVQGTAMELAGYLDADISRMSYWAAGINHMAWYLDLRLDGEDAYPKLRKIAESRESIDLRSQHDGAYAIMLKKDFSDAVRFEIMKHFGYYVSESPFHMSEYVPYFRKTPEMIKSWNVGRRWWLESEKSRDHVIDDLEELLSEGADIPMKITPEYAPEVIRAHITGNIFRANLNVYNDGLITNLPDDCCVEVPCFVDTQGIHPCKVGDLPAGVAGLNMSNVAVHRAMAEAAITKDKRYIYEAIKLDPFTAGQCTLEQIDALSSELIALNQEYLADFH